MSEDLENKDVKVTPEKKTARKTTKKIVTKKSAQKSKTPKVVNKQHDESLNAEYKYKAKEGETLIIDTPSTPLKKVELEEVKLVKEIKNNSVQMQKLLTPKTNGQIYETYIKELKDFKLVYNGDVIFDSTLSKNNSTLNFESDYFVLFGKKYSYNGLRIQKI